jgi:hypothetical protein
MNSLIYNHNSNTECVRSRVGSLHYTVLLLLKVPHKAALQVRNSKFSEMLKFLPLLLLTQSRSLSKALPCLWPNLTIRTYTQCQGKIRAEKCLSPPPPLT